MACEIPAPRRCTRLVTWYRNSHASQVLKYSRNGDVVQSPFSRDGGALQIDLGGEPLKEIDHLEVLWPSSRLAQMTLIDTPGIASISAEVSDRTYRFLGGHERAAPADAVIYLLRHLHSTDIRFLEAFHDDEVAQATPINAVGVLSRADEVGCCRLQAMDAARRIAHRYQSDKNVQRLCQVVVPVAALIASSTTQLLGIFQSTPYAAGSNDKNTWTQSSWTLVGSPGTLGPAPVSATLNSKGTAAATITFHAAASTITRWGRSSAAAAIR